jgi:Ca2+-binding RTX toxin-like protein
VIDRTWKGLPFTSRVRRQGGLTLAVLAALLGLAPAAAMAAGTVTVTLTPATPTQPARETVQFVAGAPDTNQITVTGSPDQLTLTDIVPINTAAPGCSNQGPNTVVCNAPSPGGIRRLDATLGNGSDRITSSANVRSVFRGEDGNDELQSGPADDFADGLGIALLGGPGADQISGGAGDDRLSGSEGAGAGDGEADVVNGGPGDDFFTLPATEGNDTLIGGPDIDIVTAAPFFFDPTPVAGHFTLGDGAANDGFDLPGAGPGDPVSVQAANISEIEDLAVEDRLNFETFLFEGTDLFVRGNAAENSLTTGSGDDDVDGLAGSDKLVLGEGDDEAEARDGFQDRIRCGPGEDAARVDQLDVVSACETVTTSFVRPFGVPPPTPPRYVLPPPPPPPRLADCPPGIQFTFTLTAGNDVRVGTTMADLIFAGAGNDIIDGLSGDDCLSMGTGNDRGQGGLGSDLVLGGLGDDILLGATGSDRLNGDEGNDRVEGNAGNDRVFGGAGRDNLLGAAGNDALHGQSGNDRISASSGRDRVNGGSGSDRISGGSSADTINGDAGNDRINGGGSPDVLRGNSGNDRVSARDGRRDRINCGTGRDSVTADRADRVTRNCERVRRR